MCYPPAPRALCVVSCCEGARSSHTAFFVHSTVRPESGVRRGSRLTSRCSVGCGDSHSTHRAARYVCYVFFCSRRPCRAPPPTCSIGLSRANCHVEHFRGILRPHARYPRFRARRRAANRARYGPRPNVSPRSLHAPAARWFSPRERTMPCARRAMRRSAWPHRR